MVTQRQKKNLESVRVITTTATTAATTTTTTIKRTNDVVVGVSVVAVMSFFQCNNEKSKK